MKFARGFKSHCEQLVQQLRSELALADLAPINMDALASHLCIPVWSLSQMLKAANADRACLNVSEVYRKVSAFTFFDGSRRRVVYNEEHGPARHRSNMAHEFAHALLSHPPADSGLSAGAEEVNEAEAGWLGGVLMLPAHHAKHVAATGMRREDAARHFQISPEMLRFRLNVTGAAKMAA